MSEKIKFYKGSESDLSKIKNIEAGALYYCEDTKNTYIGKSNDTFEIFSTANNNYYGVCNTAANQSKKLVSISNFIISIGCVVIIKFVNDVQNAATLEINGIEGTIFYSNVAIKSNVIKANDTITFIYDGENYNVVSIDRWQKDIQELPKAIEMTYEEYKQIQNPDPNTMYFIKNDFEFTDKDIQIGTANISGIGDGTITGAISKLYELIQAIPGFKTVASESEATRDTVSNTYYFVPEED